MFDIGLAELLAVAVVALLVVGPERLPMALKGAGLWLGRIKRAITGVQKEISEELRVEEMRRKAKEQQEKLEREAGAMTRPFSETLREDILKGGDADTTTGESDSGHYGGTTEGSAEDPAADPAQAPSEDQSRTSAS